MRNITISYTKN